MRVQSMLCELPRPIEVWDKLEAETGQAIMYNVQAIMVKQGRAASGCRAAEVVINNLVNAAQRSLHTVRRTMSLLFA